MDRGGISYGRDAGARRGTYGEELPIGMFKGGTGNKLVFKRVSKIKINIYIKLKAN